MIVKEEIHVWIRFGFGRNMGGVRCSVAVWLSSPVLHRSIRPPFSVTSTVWKSVNTFWMKSELLLLLMNACGFVRRSRMSHIRYKTCSKQWRRGERERERALYFRSTFHYAGGVVKYCLDSADHRIPVPIYCDAVTNYNSVAISICSFEVFDMSAINTVVIRYFLL